MKNKVRVMVQDKHFPQENLYIKYQLQVLLNKKIYLIIIRINIFKPNSSIKETGHLRI
jgi:hypothetical protein